MASLRFETSLDLVIFKSVSLSLAYMLSYVV